MQRIERKTLVSVVVHSFFTNTNEILEFAYEIGSSLLTEVRRLQSLLAERDKSLQDMKEEKDDLERSLDSLRVALRTQEANAGKGELSSSP
jgi:cell division protein FtsB